MNYYYIIALFIITFTVTAWLTWFLIEYLKVKQIIDNPEARSNHTIPKPRGGGIATVAVLTLLYPIFSDLAFNDFYQPVIITSLIFILGGIGFIDDVKSMSPLSRFLVQLLVIALMTFILFPKHNLILPNAVNYQFDKLLLVILVTYFVNIYNFMDGIDGITASNTIAILLGVAGIIILNNLGLNSVLYLISMVIGACLGFLIFNWSPSKIFYGDSGSLTLGLVTAFCLLKIAYEGYFAAALLFPGYYIFDASLTIIRRLLAGEKIWEAHSKHFYQLAVRKGYSHSQVVIVISIINLILILIALFALPRTSLPLL